MTETKDNHDNKDWRVDREKSRLDERSGPFGHGAKTTEGL